MAVTTTGLASRAPFVADRDSLTQDTGGTITWASVPSSAPFLDANGKKMVPAGYPMAAAALSGETGPAGSGPMVPANDGTANCLLATDAYEDSRSDAASGYGRILGGVIYANLLPVTLAAAAITNLQAQGTGFAFRTYRDTTT